MNSTVKKVIFVCTGNTCRSPMAEGILKKEVKSDLIIISRGIIVDLPMEANKNAIIVASKNNIELKNHRAKQFSENEVNKNTLILTMTSYQKEFLIDAYSNLANQVFVISEYIGEIGDIRDPIGGSIDVYKNCFTQLEKNIKNLIENKKWRI